MAVELRSLEKESEPGCGDRVGGNVFLWLQKSTESRFEGENGRDELVRPVDSNHGYLAINLQTAGTFLR